MHIQELIGKVARIAGKIENLRVIETPAAFVQLQGEIDEVQKHMQSDSICEVRYLWYTHGLQNYEQCYVVPVENKVPGWDQFAPDKSQGPYAAPGVIMSGDIIFSYLNRKHLGTHFPNAYWQVRRLCERLVVATKDAENVHDYWVRSMDLTEGKLLDGSL